MSALLEMRRLVAEIESQIPAGGTVELARQVRPESFAALDELSGLIEDTFAAPGDTEVLREAHEWLRLIAEGEITFGVADGEFAVALIREFERLASLLPKVER